MPAQEHVATLLDDVKRCTLCAAHLVDGVRPVLLVNPRARILIAGQAPGRKVHASGVPFDDATRVAILPMGFCYPCTGKSGDLLPRKECAPKWRTLLLESMPDIQLVLVIGHYAIEWHLLACAGANLTSLATALAAETSLTAS